MPDTATTVETMTARKLAFFLGASDKSVFAAIRDGKFPKALMKKTEGSNLPIYYVPEDDPFLQELISIKADRRPLPAPFEDRGESLRKAAEERALRAKRKAEREARKAAQNAPPQAPAMAAPATATPAGPTPERTQAAPASPAPTLLQPVASQEPSPVQGPSSVVPQSSGLSASPLPGSPASASGGKTAWRTGIWAVDERTNSSGFLRNLPGEQTDPELLKRKVGAGTYYLKVEKWTGRQWLLDEGRSVWPPMDPLVILSDEEEGAAQPGTTAAKPVLSPSPMDVERSRDQEFFRKQAEARVADASRPRGDEGMAHAISDMAKANAEAVSKGFSTTNDGVQKLAEAMREDARVRVEQNKEEAKAREDQHKRDMEEMRERAKADQDRIHAESESRLKEIELRAKLDADLRKEEATRRDDSMKREWEEKLSRDREWMATITKNKDEVAAAIREAQDTKLDAVVGTVTNKAEELEARFKEKMEYLAQLNELKASMQPMHLIASTIQSLGEKFSSVLGPALQQGGFGIGPGAGIGNAGQGTKLLPNGGEGGQQMSMLAKIKASPDGKEMLKDFLVQVAQYARDDEPVDLIGQGILSATATIPMFAAALAELYKTPVAEVVRGVLEPGTEEYKVLTSDKGTKFWATLHAFLKDYYNQLAAARVQAQAQVQPPAAPAK